MDGGSSLEAKQRRTRTLATWEAAPIIERDDKGNPVYRNPENRRCLEIFQAERHQEPL